MTIIDAPQRTHRKPSSEASSKDSPQRPRRITVDLTNAASQEVDRLTDITGLTTADLFRHALSLFRIYVKAKERQQEVRLVGSDKNEPQTLIELPIHLKNQEPDQ